MGYIRHHAIIVTSWSDKHIEHAYSQAVEIFGEAVSPIVNSKHNDYGSFFIAPDGSKEGWEESDEGDDLRERFVEWLNHHRYDDGSSPFDWAEIQYGDDDKQTLVCRHSDEKLNREDA